MSVRIGTPGGEDIDARRLTVHQVSFFILLIREKLRNDLVALLIVVSLAVTGVLTAEEAVRGFASEPALVVAVIFVLSGALHQTGVSDTIGRWIGRLAGADEPLREGDVLLVRTTPEQLVQIRQESGLELHPIDQYGQEAPSDENDAEEIAEKLVQAVAAPGSDLVNRTLGDIDFRQRFGAIVVSIWRQNGWLREEMSRVRLRAGDVLVLQGDDEALQRVGDDGNLLIYGPGGYHFTDSIRAGAPLTVLVSIAVVLMTQIVWPA